MRSQIVINEVCINNASTIYDFEHEYEDWIELYNAGTTIQNLAGYSITDNTLQPQKWVFPNAVLAPGDYLIIWASDKNLKKHPDTLHTNFKLSENETIALYNTSHTLVDAKQIPNTRLDHSFGRINNGSLDWAFMKPSSPKAPNLEASSFMTYNRDSIKFSLKAGFYTGAQELTLAGGTEIRYTTDGSEPSPSSPRYTGPIHIDSTQTIKACKFDNQSQPFYTWAATYF
ncbi:MAG TPA: lamin tail domain-containing protein, partial [Cytophagales bacterium]|nr:lamin tail domain-containing protein [Cytophagales bacterium]